MIRVLITLLFAVVLTPTISLADDVNAHIKSQARALFEAAKKQGPRFSLVGELKAGKNTPYSVNGEDFSVATDALTIGTVGVGKMVKVRGIITDGKKIVKKIIVAENTSSSNGDTSDGSDAEH